MLSPAVFKAYDVRGIVPDELDADGAYALARGYVDAFEPRVMAIGRDMRLSSTTSTVTIFALPVVLMIMFPEEKILDKSTSPCP